MPYRGRSNNLLLILAAFSLAAALSLLNHFVIPLPIIVLIAVRWAAIGSFVLYALAKRSLTTWIIVAMIIGANVGYDWPALAINLRVVSMIFLRLIKTIIAPLLFATLVNGIAAHSDLKKVGRMGLKALIFFEVATTLALFIGLTAINISKAGVGARVPHATSEVLPAERLSASETILHIFPENIAKAVADNQVLQVVIFSIIFGIALAMLSEEKRRPLLAVVESLAEVMFKFTNVVMYLAPLGVGAAVAYTVGSTGLGIMVYLGKLLLTLYVALFIFVLGVLLPIALFFRVSIKKFFAAVTEPVSIAFATASSESALPRAMENMESIGVPREVVAFVMPTGYSFNLTGTALYLSLCAMFIAQAAGIQMSLGKQLLMMVTLMLTSKGAAGVPRTALVILLATAASFGLPIEPIFLLLGIDQFMDMARSAVNVLGNCLATVIVSKWEGDFGSEQSSVLEESFAPDSSG